MEQRIRGSLRQLADQLRNSREGWTKTSGTHELAAAAFGFRQLCNDLAGCDPVLSGGSLEIDASGDGEPRVHLYDTWSIPPACGGVDGLRGEIAAGLADAANGAVAGAAAPLVAPWRLHEALHHAYATTERARSGHREALVSTMTRWIPLAVDPDPRRHRQLMIREENDGAAAGRYYRRVIQARLTGRRMKRGWQTPRRARTAALAKVIETAAGTPDQQASEKEEAPRRDLLEERWNSPGQRGEQERQAMLDMLQEAWRCSGGPQNDRQLSDALGRGYERLGEITWSELPAEPVRLTRISDDGGVRIALVTHDGETGGRQNSCAQTAAWLQRWTAPGEDTGESRGNREGPGCETGYYEAGPLDAGRVPWWGMDDRHAAALPAEALAETMRVNERARRELGRVKELGAYLLELHPGALEHFHAP